MGPNLTPGRGRWCPKCARTWLEEGEACGCGYQPLVHCRRCGGALRGQYPAYMAPEPCRCDDPIDPDNPQEAPMGPKPTFADDGDTTERTLHEATDRPAAYDQPQSFLAAGHGSAQLACSRCGTRGPVVTATPPPSDTDTDAAPGAVQWTCGACLVPPVTTYATRLEFEIASAGELRELAEGLAADFDRHGAGLCGHRITVAPIPGMRADR